MHRLRHTGPLALLAVLGSLFSSTWIPAAAAPLAQTNLLTNSSFDSGFYSSGGNPDIQVGNGWAAWHEDSGQKSDCPPCNYVLGPKWISEANTALVQQGSHSQHVGNEYDPWHGGVFQTVTATPGARARFTAYIRVRASNEQYPDPSYTNFIANGQVGIDPNGSGNWTSGVSWSGTVNSHDTWQPVSIEATTGAAGKVSVFISANWRGQTAAHLDAWFDNASLETVSALPTSAPGQPTSTPIPPQPGDQFLTPFPTPTPGLDGRIVYVVKPGDSLWRIAAVSGISLEELKALNNLTSDLVTIGQQLVLGAVSQPATPTATPRATVEEGSGSGQSTEPPPATEVAANPPAAAGNICYQLYEDLNGNALRDTGESPVASGQFLISNVNGQPVDSYTTTDDASQEPHCTRDLAVGGYNISVAPPAGYNPTTNTSSPLTLEAGATVNLEFGAQESAVATPASDDAAAPSNAGLRTALYGAAGVVFLLLAAGLAGFLFLSRRSA